MAVVIITASALKEYNQVPLTIRIRIDGVFARLKEWPAVSGAKPLRGDLRGKYRIRTGDWRVIFEVTVRGDVVTVTKIGYRGGVYDD